ncbi:MAG TPA: hypothetical protein VHO46_11900 [Bacteroidales bacterium]|nr:hypothetical protein [Bacteroidales bacterium]
MGFEELHKQFEKKETDLSKLQKDKGFSRYILIRSLDNDHVRDLIKANTKIGVTKNDSNYLWDTLFKSDVTQEQIIKYIRKKYPDVSKQRREQEEYLPNIIKEFDIVKCGIRNDNLNELTKDLVRDKTIKSKEDLEKKVNLVVNSTIKGYILWQYYNQVTNDLIEHFFNDHKNVIPTLRKITYVDFLIDKNNEIIPFDLKITHISDDYFDWHMKGLTNSADGNDSYKVRDGKSELEVFKAKYKSLKNELKLPNYGGLDKEYMYKILLNNGDLRTKKIAEELLLQRNKMINEIEKNPTSVEWWNYKFQGERLFKNNNRFFIFLAYKNSFEDARPLKGNLELIKDKVNKKLDSIITDDLNNIRYYYNKEKRVEGAYQILSTSILVTNS